MGPALVRGIRVPDHQVADPKDVWLVLEKDKLLEVARLTSTPCSRFFMRTCCNREAPVARVRARHTSTIAAMKYTQNNMNNSCGSYLKPSLQRLHVMNHAPSLHPSFWRLRKAWALIGCNSHAMSLLKLHDI